MKLVDIAIIVSTILASFFPAFLINAIRSPDEDQAAAAKGKACATFAVLIFLALCVVNS